MSDQRTIDDTETDAADRPKVRARLGEHISTGKLVAGRWLGVGGLLGPRARITHGDSRPADSAPPKGPKVLMAIDGDAMSESVVHGSQRLFGKSATYLAINVGPGPYSDLSWAYVWPVGGTTVWVDPTPAFDDSGDRAVEAARRRANAIAHDAGLTQVTPIGDVGDPTSAIIRAAHHHNVDVVVIGADHRSWLSHLVDPSVERELLREADFSVLVAAQEVQAEPARSADDAHTDPLINRFTA